MTERTAEMDQHDFDLRSRVVNLEHGSTGFTNRLTALELWKYQSDIADAVRDEQGKNIREDLTSIKGTLSRLNWLMISGIILGVIAFLLRGGFKIP
jgi:hypothetical protein